MDITFDAASSYSELERIHSAQDLSLKDRYNLLFNALHRFCEACTSESGLTFSNIYSHLTHVCRQLQMDSNDTYRINRLRIDWNILNDKAKGKEVTNEDFRYDLKALVMTIRLYCKTPYPQSLGDIVNGIGDRPITFSQLRGTKLAKVRAVVENITERDKFTATIDDEDQQQVTVDYQINAINNDMGYLNNILASGMTVNLINVTISEQGIYQPALIVVYPDYLVDISSIAACYAASGTNSLNYILKRYSPRPNTQPILLGNIASQMLDDLIHTDNPYSITLGTSLRKFFMTAGFDFATCDNFNGTQFKNDATLQLENLRQIIGTTFSTQGLDKEKIVLEPSFICETLGMQGRMDLILSDFSVVIEQKSGKMDEWRQTHQETHYIQMLLYRECMKYNFGIKDKQIKSYLLYSKYPFGLMEEASSATAFHGALKIRNEIVAREYSLARGGIGQLLKNTTAADLITNDIKSYKFLMMLHGQLNEVLSPIAAADSLQLKYFNCFSTFLTREQILSKTGYGTMNHGFSATWNSTLSEKTESGDIFTNATIVKKIETEQGRGIDEITLRTTIDDDFLPNFRPGDIVLLYSYKNTPDVRKQQVFKGKIKSMTDCEVVLKLNYGQRNESVFVDGTYAIEHDYMDAGYTSSYRGLMSLLTAPKSRQDLILNQAKPTLNESVTINGDYGDFNGLVRGAKQANDYFIIIGPPGTGKTSIALKNLVMEALTDHRKNILLLSFTNRAVDEICEVLISDEISSKSNFIRVSSEMSCPEQFQPNLAQNVFGGCHTLEEIQGKITSTRIFVGTAASLSGMSSLFSKKHFDVAIIDEASQILEPQLLGVLCATGINGQPAVDKFIFIGDHKQLPAVVQQSERSSEVQDAELRGIGLTNCRNSLFERLLNNLRSNNDEKFIFQLHCQGRMHEELAEFPSKQFYGGELTCIKVERLHQPLSYNNSTAQDNIDKLIITYRRAFIDVPTNMEELSSNAKTNEEEAKVVAALMASAQKLYKLNGMKFTTEKTLGVIVPYRNQISMIRKQLRLIGCEDLCNVAIDTVERFQGSQRDIIIYSFTVNQPYQLSFINGNLFREGNNLIDRKLNVALTRAREQLFVVGYRKLLEMHQSPTTDFITDLSEANEYFCENNLPDFYKDVRKKFQS
jgi:DNA replication ATP-dependent helicase Dna2